MTGQDSDCGFSVSGGHGSIFPYHSASVAHFSRHFALVAFPSVPGWFLEAFR